MLQLPGGFLLTEVISLRQHFQIRNVLCLLENFQENIGVNGFTMPPGNQSDGEGKSRKQAQGLSTKKDPGGTLLKPQLSAGWRKGFPQNQPPTQMPGIGPVLVLIGFVFLNPVESFFHLLHGILKMRELFPGLPLAILQQMTDVQCLVRLPVAFRIPQGDVQLQTH